MKTYHSRYFNSLYYLQAVSSKITEKQRSAFGGSGFYAKFSKRFYRKLIKKMRVESMGFSEFEHEAFPDTLSYLKDCMKEKTIYIGNFKLKNQKTIYYLSHFDMRFDIEKAVLNYEENNSKKYKDRKKIQFSKSGRDGFVNAIESDDPFINGWFDIRNRFFFSLSRQLTLDVYELIKNHRKFHE
jgi:hypothetical protein